MSRETDTYFVNRVNSATPGEIVVMLYDGLARFAGEARDIYAAGQGDLLHADERVKRCIDILGVLAGALNPEAAPELSEQLSNLYDFFVREFNDAQHDRDAARIDGILPLIDELRGAWVEAEANVSRQNVPSDTTA